MTIFIGNLTRISDEKYSIGHMHSMPFDKDNGYKINDVLATEEQLLLIGKLKELPLELANIYNNPQILYYNPIDDNCFYDYQYTTEEIKIMKIEEISQSCQSAIYGGFRSTSHEGIDKMYGSTLEDQANITGNALSAISKVAGTPGCENDKFYYHAKDEEFVEWTAEQCLKLARDFKIFKETQLFKSKLLQNYVDTLILMNEINNVTWDTAISS